MFAAWQDNSSGQDQIYAAQWNGAAWLAAGAGADSGGGVSDADGSATSPVLAANGGSLYLLWLNNRVAGSNGNAVANYVKMWNGSAFVEQIPGDSSYNGIGNTIDAPTAPALAVNAAGLPFAAWQDDTGGGPQIYVRGDLFSVNTIHYVNAGNTLGSAFTTAPGSDAGNGLTPVTAKASMTGVFNDVNNPVAAGDVIEIDAGTYDGFTLNAAASGVYMLGSPNGPTVIQGPVEIVGAANLTLENIVFQGGLTLDGCTNVTLSNDTFEGAGITIDGGSNNQIVHDSISITANTGIALTDGAAGTVIEYNQIEGGQQGIAVTGAGVTGLDVRFNQLGQSGTGLALSNAASGQVSGNIVSATGTALLVAASFTGPIEDNAFTGAAVGVAYQASAFLSNNRIYGNMTGVSSTVADPSSALGFAAGSQPNQIFDNVTGVLLTNAAMQQQHVYDNQVGVTGSGSLVAADLAHANVIEANAVGIQSFSGPIEFNRIDRDGIGVEAQSSQLIAHNDFYETSQTALEIQGQTDVRVFNNTFDSLTGDLIRIEGSSSEVEVQNNILWSGAGYDLFVADDSQSGFYSDYNDLYSTAQANSSPGTVMPSPTSSIGSRTLTNSTCTRLGRPL